MVEDETDDSQLESVIEGPPEEYDIDLEGSILMIMKVWGTKGITREILYDTIRGLKHDPMKKTMVSLESRGYVTIEWLDLDRFFAYITESGLEYLDTIIGESDEIEKD
jgi:hypothetical protein